MSTASASPTLTTLPERAFSLHCSGLRSPAIAQQLGVPERTVRAWIARIRDDIAAENTTLLREEFIRAIEHLHQLSAAAWAAFEDEQTQAHSPANDAQTADLPATTLPPRHSPRYLRLALDAQRHISRLFGHFDDLRAGSLDFNAASTPTSPSAPPAPVLAPVFSPAPAAETDIPAKSATTAADTESEIPAESATAPAVPPLSPAFRPTALAPAVYGRDSSPPAESATGAGDAETDIPAKTATVMGRRDAGGMPTSPSLASACPAAPLSAHGAGSRRNVACSEEKAGQGPGVRSPLPAKTATPPSRPVTTPAFPATIPIHWRM